GKEEKCYRHHLSSSSSEDEKEDQLTKKIEVDQLAEEIVRKVSRAVEAIERKKDRPVKVEIKALAGLAAVAAAQ
ncbi:4127_t:CDS:1, partial [Dentiscutata erythropus]